MGETARRSVGRLTVLGVALCLPSCNAVFPDVQRSDSAALQTVVDGYLRAQQAEDLDEAYGAFCAGSENREDFDKRVRDTVVKIGRIRSWRITAADELSNGEGVVKYDLVTDQDNFERKVDLARSDDGWCLSHVDRD